MMPGCSLESGLRNWDVGRPALRVEGVRVLTAIGKLGRVQHCVNFSVSSSLRLLFYYVRHEINMRSDN